MNAHLAVELQEIKTTVLLNVNSFLKGNIFSVVNTKKIYTVYTLQAYVIYKMSYKIQLHEM